MDGTTAMRLQRSGQALGQGAHKALATSLLPVPAGQGGVASAGQLAWKWERHHIGGIGRIFLRTRRRRTHARPHAARTRERTETKEERGERADLRGADARQSRGSGGAARLQPQHCSHHSRQGAGAARCRAGASAQAPFRGAGASAKRRSGAEAQHCATARWQRMLRLRLLAHHEDPLVLPEHEVLRGTHCVRGRAREGARRGSERGARARRRRAGPALRIIVLIPVCEYERPRAPLAK